MRIEGLFGSIDISASGLKVQRRRMEATASNLANASTTQTEEGGPYRRQRVVLRASDGHASFSTVAQRARLKLKRAYEQHLPSLGARPRSSTGRGMGVVSEVVRDTSPPRIVYDPSHLDADAEGYVALPNVNVVAEMVDMISAARAYEANITAMNAAKGMAKKALEI